jgi:hypothetical protein
MSARVLAAAAAVTASLIATALAGCGQAAVPGRLPAGPGIPLATSFAGRGDVWAVLPVPAGTEHFWELVGKHAGGRWALVTPPGVEDTGGLAVGSHGGRSLVAGFRPTADQVFSPLAVTADGGATWSPGGLFDPGLADVPDALAAAPDGRLLALLSGGQVALSAPGTSGGVARWTPLASRRSLAAGTGRECGLTRLTAAAFSSSGTPLLGGICTRRGAVGIFAYRDGGWRAAGPALPRPLAAGEVQVLRLTVAGPGEVALLAVGRPPGVKLLVARARGGDWALSAPLRLGASWVTSVAFGADGSVGATLPGGRAVLLRGIGDTWQPLPALPPGTATLALEAGGQAGALAVSGNHLVVWQAAPGTTGWSRTQTLAVPLR